MPKISYSKSPLSYVEQIEQLKSRGLIIENEEKAIHILTQISYYRLSGYWYPLLEEPKSEHKFKEDSTFDNGFKLYCFDRELRKLIQSELEKIEVAVRSKMIYVLWHNHNAFWFNKTSFFKSEYAKNKILEKI
jgi:abortive infection bacteriophage resistance protein